MMRNVFSQFILTLPLLTVITSTNVNASDREFVEIRGTQVIAEDGFYEGSWEVANSGAEFGERRIFIAYMDNSGQRNDPHNIYVLQYDYETGKWTKSPSLGSPASGNTNHNSPSIIRDRKGYLHVFFGANAYGYEGNQEGPRYVKSSRPDDITQWGPFSHLPLPGGGKSSQQIIGATTEDNSLHLFGFGNNGGNQAILYSHLNSASNVWSHSHLIAGPNHNIWHAPEGYDIRIIDDVIHLTWTINPGDEPQRGYVGYNVFYARSADKGQTWTNINGTSSFSKEVGLKQNQGLPNPSYPNEFLVTNADTYGRTRVGRLSNGQVVVLHGDASGVVFNLWTGDKWVNSNVDKAGYPLSIAMEVLTRDRIVVYVSSAKALGGIMEYVSSNAGKTWDESEIVKAGTSELTNLIATTVVVPQGHRERILINWTGAYNRSGNPPSNHRKIFFLDRVFD